MIKKICTLSLLATCVAAIGAAAAQADSPYNYTIPPTTPSHMANYIEPKSALNGKAPLRDTNGVQITYSNGTPAYVTARKSSRCPRSTVACLQVQGYGPAITTSAGKTLYYVWEWQDYTKFGDLAGLVAQSDLTATPVLSRDATAGNGSGAEFIFSAGHPVYTVTPTPIPWAFGYRGATDGESHQFTPYGQLETNGLYANYALMTWNWVDVGGGGISEASVRSGEQFYPATNVAPITLDAFVYTAKDQPLGAQLGTVTARYGAVWNGVRQVWGWMAVKHTYAGSCVNHVAYSSGNALADTTC